MKNSFDLIEKQKYFRENSGTSLVTLNYFDLFAKRLVALTAGTSLKSSP